MGLKLFKTCEYKASPYFTQEVKAYRMRLSPQSLGEK